MRTGEQENNRKEGQKKRRTREEENRRIEFNTMSPGSPSTPGSLKSS